MLEEAREREQSELIEQDMEEYRELMRIRGR
jgi:hypothetical protein